MLSYTSLIATYITIQLNNLCYDFKQVINSYTAYKPQELMTAKTFPLLPAILSYS